MPMQQGTDDGVDELSNAGRGTRAQALSAAGERTISSVRTLQWRRRDSVVIAEWSVPIGARLRKPPNHERRARCAKPC